MFLNRWRARHDEGFTLIEMVVTVAIMGTISVALFGVVLGYLKTSVSTRTRLNESADQQFVSTYWQTDVSSLGQRLDPTTTSVPGDQSVWRRGHGVPAGCGDSIAGGVVVVRFGWSKYSNGGDADHAWDQTKEYAAYVATPSGTGYGLKRIRCHGATAESPITVAHNLTSIPDVSCVPVDCESATPPSRVSMTIVVSDTSQQGSTTGYTSVLTADRRQG